MSNHTTVCHMLSHHMTYNEISQYESLLLNFVCIITEVDTSYLVFHQQNFLHRVINRQPQKEIYGINSSTQFIQNYQSVLSIVIYQYYLYDFQEPTRKQNIINKITNAIMCMQCDLTLNHLLPGFAHQSLITQALHSGFLGLIRLITSGADKLD